MDASSRSSRAQASCAPTAERRERPRLGPDRRPTPLPGRASPAATAVSRPLVALLLALVAGAAPASAAEPLCRGVASLALLAMDTAAGRALLTLSASDGLRLVEVEALDDVARLHPLPPGPPRFAGSNGPGPLLALGRCGASCIQVERWDDGAWRPEGEPLEVPSSLNFYTTYDRSGRPWVVAHTPAGEAGWVEARAFRLAGSRWQERGRLTVTGVTTQGAMSAAWRRDGVVTGTGLFTADAAPSYWVAGLPALPAEKRGQVVPLGNGGAAYLAADGAVYTSGDGGRTWRGSRWRPWGVERTQIWSFGADYSLDVPLGALDDPLPIFWFDRRERDATRVILTTVGAGGDWNLRAELPAEIVADTGERLEIVHFLRTAGGIWMLLSDCFAAGSTTGLARRTYTAAGLGPPRFVVLQ